MAMHSRGLMFRAGACAWWAVGAGRRACAAAHRLNAPASAETAAAFVALFAAAAPGKG
jgi:hypothetical protein